MNIVNILVLAFIMMLILILVFKNKNTKILFTSVIIVVFVFSFIQILRFINPVFRINYDIRFNNTREHITYISGDDYYLPLPKGTVQAYRHSDTGVMYYTKLTYDEFINYYYETGYIVENNDIVCDGIKYILKQNDEYDGKYTAIDIETFIDE